MYAKKEKTHAAYAPKNNSNHEKQVILFMFSNTENSDYLAVKNLKEEQHQKMAIFIVWIVFIPLEQKKKKKKNGKNLNPKKNYVKIICNVIIILIIFLM